jgi:hypothetical protein
MPDQDPAPDIQVSRIRRVQAVAVRFEGYACGVECFRWRFSAPRGSPADSARAAAELRCAAPRDSLDTLLVGRRIGRMHLVCYLRQGSKVFETYWTTSRGVEVMDNSFHLLDLTVYGRQESWEDSPTGWPQQWEADANQLRTNGRPTAQWSRLKAGRSDNLGTKPR